MRTDMLRSILSLAYENISTGVETLPEVKLAVTRMSGLSMAERRFVTMACHSLDKLRKWTQRPALHLVSAASGINPFTMRCVDRGTSGAGPSIGRLRDHLGFPP